VIVRIRRASLCCYDFPGEFHAEYVLIFAFLTSTQIGQLLDYSQDDKSTAIREISPIYGICCSRMYGKGEVTKNVNIPK
jgi:hypothetical protein